MKNENQSGHTAGPWHGETSCVRNVYGANGKYIATAYPTLQDNQTDWEKDSIPEAEANGRLIAAAPDLLKAVNGSETLIQKAQDIIAEWILPDSPTTDEQAMSQLLELLDGPWQRQVQEANKSAISKAKGQSCPA